MFLKASRKFLLMTPLTTGLKDGLAKVSKTAADIYKSLSWVFCGHRLR